MTKARDLATSGPSAGLVLLHSETVSAVSNISVDNIFNSTYDNYYVTCTLESPSADAYFSMRLRASAADISTGYYATWLEYAIPTTGNVRSANNDNRVWGNAVDSATANGYHWNTWIFNPFKTTRTTYTIANVGVNSLGTGITSNGGGYEGQSGGSRDGIKFYLESGTGNFTINIYGVKK